MDTDEIHRLVESYQNLINIFLVIHNFLTENVHKKQTTAEQKLMKLCFMVKRRSG